MDNVEKAVILEEAAVVIEERGWTTGEYADGDTGAVCAMGALYCAASGWDTHRYITILDEIPVRDVMDELPIEMHLVAWNDHHAKGPEAVIDLFMSTAKKLRNEG